MNWPLIRRVVRDMELRDGKHIHTKNATHGEQCQGGDSECPLWDKQLKKAMEDWT